MLTLDPVSLISLGPSWTRGIVDAIAFQGDEPVWSANIKRGVAALFQVNLDHSYAANPNMDKGMRFDPIQPSYTVWEVCAVVSIGFLSELRE